MVAPQHGERGCSPRIGSGRRPESRTEQLHCSQPASSTATVVEVHRMHPVLVDDHEVVIGRGMWHGADAVVRLPMPQLDTQPHVLEGSGGEGRSLPLLQAYKSEFWPVSRS
jgi:hypothetical protein